MNNEKLILGKVINDHRNIDDVFGRITPDDFQEADHRIIAEYCLILRDRLGRASLLTVLKKDGSSIGDHFIDDLVDHSIGGSLDVAVDMVKEASLSKQFTKFGYNLIEKDKDEYKDKRDFAEKELMKLSDDGVVAFSEFTEVLPNLSEHLQKRMNGDRPEILTGIASLDRMLGGLFPEAFYVIGGRPGMGKTALALSIIYNVKETCGLMSLEMSKNENASRLLSMKSRLPYEKIRQANFSGSDFDHLLLAFKDLKEKPFFIDDTAGINIYQIKSKARRMVKKGAKIIFLDYLQLVGGQKGEMREQFIAGLSRECKILSRELKVPFVAMTQLNRQSTQRADKRPGLSDIRESGAIEQDADCVMFVHRDLDDDIERAELIIAKNRHGATGSQ